MTYNIHKGYGLGKLRFLLPKMRQAMEAINPDFAFLQEVQGEHRWREKRINAWPDSPQFQYLAANIWPHYAYAKNAIYYSGHHGNAILGKYPFDVVHNVNLSNISRASRGFLHNQVNLGSPIRRVHLLCVHLGLFKTERLSQCLALIQRIKAFVPNDEPLIMAGDFNDWRHRLSTILFDELGVSEAFFSLEGEHARSFPAIKPTLCVDRIYFRGMVVEEVACLSGKPWQKLSDHLPLLARFRINS